MPGPSPKAANQRRRRNATPGARMLVPVETGTMEVPALPGRHDGMEWHPAAVEMWESVAYSPMWPEFDRSDTQGMLRLLDLVHEYWSITPDVKGSQRLKVLLAAEIRLESQNFGLSPLDRRRLQWEISRAEEAVDQTVRRRAASRAGRADPRTAAI